MIPALILMLALFVVNGQYIDLREELLRAELDEEGEA